MSIDFVENYRRQEVPRSSRHYLRNSFWILFPACFPSGVHSSCQRRTAVVSDSRSSAAVISSARIVQDVPSGDSSLVCYRFASRLSTRLGFGFTDIPGSGVTPSPGNKRFAEKKEG